MAAILQHVNKTMLVCLIPAVACRSSLSTGESRSMSWMLILGLLIAILLRGAPAFGQDQSTGWQDQVRKYAAAQDWDSALRAVDQEVARAPRDMDVRAWRARVLTWSGNLAAAETEYLEILKTSQTDPDNWLGVANVYLRQGKTVEALDALDTAVKLDPTRADLRAARARALRAAGEQREALLEFQRALDLDPTNAEARAGLASLRPEPKHELRVGQENDLFNFADANHDEWASLVSKWTPHWTTSVAGSFYQRGGEDAGKFVGSITRRQPKWGALTVGGAIGHDNGVIPRSEAFFELDHGWKNGETNLLRGMEIVYGQHWYWYRSSRILALSGTTIVYLPREWTLSVGATGARSAFSGAGAEWRPSGVTRLGFPLASWSAKRLSGNAFFATGTEDFGQVDQIGAFASHTYGGGLRFQLNSLQDIAGYASYQKRTQDRTDTLFGFSYGIHF